MSVKLNVLNSKKTSLDQKKLTFEWHILVTENIIAELSKNTVIALLAQHTIEKKTPLSIAELKSAISQGALWLTPVKNKKQTQRLRRVKKPLNIGDELHFYYNAKVLDSAVPQAQLIEDLVDYSIWYKPYGMLSQGSKWSDHCTIARFAQLNLPNERPAFIVHRLDRAATGLILIAHSKKAARALSSLFEHHQLEKTYHIIIHGDHSKRQQPEVIETDVGGKSARSHFTCLTYNNEFDRSLVSVKIDSGRKHQIRIHSASIGMPVVGDRLHGKANENESTNLQLCAISLRFKCPLTIDGQHSTEDNERFFELPETLKPQLT